MTANEVFDELIAWNLGIERSIDKLNPRELNGYWLCQVARLQRIDAKSRPLDTTPQPTPTAEPQPQDDHRLDAFRYALGHKPGQVCQDGRFVVLPSPVQQEPSPLELTARLWIGLHDSLHNLDEAANEAFQLIDAVRAEEARRAGK